MGTDTPTARELAAELGVSYRKIDYWLRTSYTPGFDNRPGTGHTRHLTAAQVAGIRAIAAVRQQIDELEERLVNGWVYLDAVLKHLEVDAE